MPKSVLILGAEQRSALAAARSLGRSHDVTVAGEIERSLAAASRYARRSLAYPSPSSHPAEFVAWARETLSDGHFDCALPVTEVTTDLLVRHRHLWPDVFLPFAPIETIDRLSDKVELYRRAVELGISAPRSVVVESPDDLAAAREQIGFPCVLKPRRSRIMTNGEFLSTTVGCAHDEAELASLLDRPDFSTYPFLYQEFVGGKGQGVFALYDSGRPVAWFAHKRLREKPAEGGVSVLSESCLAEPAIKAMAKRLLDDAAWHGVAMVEFRVDDDGTPYLMEINARFWGSLQLAIDAGVDFPALLLAGGASYVPEYRIGRRLRWLLGDFDRLYVLAKGRPGLERLVRELLAFVTPHPLTTKHEIFRWTDPAPAARELIDWFRALGKGA